MQGELLYKGVSALDAGGQGVRVEEANLKNTTVENDGAIEHTVSVTRKVMEETPHVMLAGKWALQFAIQQRFQ